MCVLWAKLKGETRKKSSLYVREVSNVTDIQKKNNFPTNIYKKK